MNFTRTTPLLTLFFILILFGSLMSQKTIESLTLPDGRLVEIRDSNKWYEVPLIMEHILGDGRIIEIFANNQWREQTVDTVKIGQQVWKNKNHDSPIFRDGTLMKQVRTEREWSRAIKNEDPVWCYYEFSEDNAYMGKIYNWYAVNGTKNIAPEGWKIPDSTDWQVLINRVKTPGDRAYLRLMDQNGWLYWNEPSDYRNSSGFSAMANGALHARYIQTQVSLKNKGFKYVNFWSINGWSCCHGSSYWFRDSASEEMKYFQISPISWENDQQLSFQTDTKGSGTFIRLIRE